MKHDVLLIGTYHKTGTVWMQRAFEPVAEALGLRYAGTHLDAGATVFPAGIYHDDHARFSDAILATDHAGFRMVRDPRDVVISGAHYHVKSHEPWLHMPREGLDGRTYQQAILSLPSWPERYDFEMRHTAKKTTRKMVNDFVRVPYFLLVRYETWMTDASLADFTAILSALGFSTREVETAAAIFQRVSLFGGREGADDHVRSGRVAQWRQVFTKALAEQFLEIYDDALIRLGYEENHDWVLALPDA